jgi:hypothetical protein
MICVVVGSRLTQTQIASALNSWDSAFGTVTLHGYNEGAVDEGFPEMGVGYDEKVRPVSDDFDLDDRHQYSEGATDWW